MVQEFYVAVICVAVPSHLHKHTLQQYNKHFPTLVVEVCMYCTSVIGTRVMVLVVIVLQAGGMLSGFSVRRFRALGWCDGFRWFRVEEERMREKH